jgi:dihydroxyacetone kinase-like predicted kinase
MINFEMSRTEQENAEAMTSSMATVRTGQVTYAVRDTSIDGKEIHKDDILGLADKGLAAVGKDIDATVLELLDTMIDDDSELVSVYYGEDITNEQASGIVASIEEKYPDVDVELQEGGQPVYYYIVSVE